MSNYPMGAEYDPRAPWLEVEAPTKPCPECNGTGYKFYAYNFVTDDDKECTEDEWYSLPEDESQARAKHIHYVRGVREECDACDGTGEVEDIPYEPDFDD